MQNINIKSETLMSTVSCKTSMSSVCCKTSMTTVNFRTSMSTVSCKTSMSFWTSHFKFPIQEPLKAISRRQVKSRLNHNPSPLSFMNSFTWNAFAFRKKAILLLSTDTQSQLFRNFCAVCFFTVTKKLFSQRRFPGAILFLQLMKQFL